MRSLFPLATRLACVLLALVPASAPAQDFFSDLFGGDDRPSRAPRAPRQRPERRYERRAPVERRAPRSAEPSHRARSERPTARREQPATRSHGATQKPETKPVQEQQPAKLGPETPPAPYDTQMLRLAELLGGLSYLRDLCGAGDGADWRNKMARLRDADAPSGSRRQKLTAAFNRSFSSYELTYRSCTPNARIVIARYLEEAEQVSSGVATRYGTP
jgi:uncharacterized protein (TIGR02301 family)